VWYVGANSINGGNNTGLIFTAGGGIDYLSISDITGTRFPFSFDTSVAESAAGVDGISTTANLTFGTSDDIAVADVNAPAYAAYPSIDETATGTDDIQSLRFLPCVVDESVDGDDAASATATWASLVPESVEATDQPPVTRASFRAAASELANATEVLNPGRSINITVAESPRATDRMNAYGLWNFIDDAEDPNWQNVDNS
jgi:hypothetical protein